MKNKTDQTLKKSLWNLQQNKHTVFQEDPTIFRRPKVGGTDKSDEASISF